MTNTPRRLRVALLASSLRLGGAEKQTVYIARAIRDAGADTRFFHLGEGGHYEVVLRQMGIPFTQIYRSNRPLLILARLTEAVWRFRPQIVFAPQFGDLLQAGMAGRLCNALVIGGLRSDGFYELNAHGRRSRRMLALAHGLVANSHRGRQNLLSRIAKPPRMTIVPNVLDLREFDARSEVSPPVRMPSDRIMAIAVGSLQPSKRFDRFLNALAQARRKAPALLGVIAGSDCGSRVALEQQAIRLGLVPNDVVFLGQCGNVPSLLAQAGFLVLSSEYEGFPNVILEAMAARLPVITTRVGDAERIVVQDQTGYVVDEADVEALADRMVELALSPATRIRLGAAGRTRVAEEYDYQALPTRLLSVFHDFAVHNRRGQLVENLQAWLPAREPNPLSEPALVA
jgi:glycosyltransferase involved in cell wall biosynthesis